MGVSNVRTHERKTPSGGTTKVSAHTHGFRDAMRAAAGRGPVDRRRKARKKRKALFSPKRAWKRLKRAFRHARRRRKLTATVLAIAGVAEIGGFVVTRGLGATLCVAALAVQAVGGGLLAMSGGESPQSESRRQPPPANRRRRPRNNNGDTAANDDTKNRVRPPRGPGRGNAPRYDGDSGVYVAAPPRQKRRPRAAGTGGNGPEPRRSGPEKSRSRRLDGKPESARDAAYFDAREKKTRRVNH